MIRQTKGRSLLVMICVNIKSHRHEKYPNLNDSFKYLDWSVGLNVSSLEQ